jgi:TPR repeat protein
MSYPLIIRHGRGSELNGVARLVTLADEAYFGFAGSPNLPLAAKYYEGDAKSAEKLGEMLEEGLGIPFDVKDARR